MEVYAKSDLGKVRDKNEDAYYIPNDDVGINVYILSDGMGGYSGGEIASSLGVAAAKSYIINNYEVTFDQKEDILKLVNGAVEYANMVIFEKSRMEENLKYMGCTMEIVLLINDKLYMAHAGDSRIYRLRNRILRKLSKDHSYIEKLIKEGKITKEEAKTHPDKNMVTKALGTMRLVEPDLIYKKFLKGDTLLICSDGLTNMVSEEEIKEVLQTSQNPEKDLIKLANNYGGSDNITVIVVKK